MRRRWRLAWGLSAALLAAPAFGFDCQKAATLSEKAICADPLARAADEAMAAAFVRLFDVETPVGKAALRAAQARWIRDRDQACDGAKARSTCLANQSAQRRAFLAGEPEAGPGATGRLAPVFRYQKGGKGRAAIDLQLLKYLAPATPGERAFNAAVDRLVGTLDEPQKDDPNPNYYAYERTMRLVFASPKFVSAQLAAFSDTGGAHPNAYSGNVNLDVARGREARLDDLLDAKGAKAVFALCLKQVVEEKKQRMGADAPLSPTELKQLEKDLADSTAKLETWSFGAREATVNYDAYAVGAYVEGAYDCVIPYAQLKPLAKPDFPLP